MTDLAKVLIAALSMLIFALPLILIFGAMLAILWYGVRKTRLAWRSWRQLADVYGFDGEIPAEHRWRFRAATLGGVYYRGGLTLAADRAGLYLAPTLLSMGRKALFFPWTEVVISDVKQFGFPARAFDFRRVPGVRLQLGKPLANRLEEKSGRTNTLSRYNP